MDASTLRKLCPPGAPDAVLWETWLKCPAVHAYESGKINEEAFVAGVLEAFSSSMTAGEFLESFAGWPRGFFPGIPELLTDLRRDYLLAYLSNSNPIHYACFQKEWRLNQYFDYSFASHLMGCAKPDPAIFSRVIAETGYRPEEIFFVDDNRLNIEAAAALQIKGAAVRGAEELRRELRQLNIL